MGIPRAFAKPRGGLPDCNAVKIFHITVLYKKHFPPNSFTLAAHEYAQPNSRKSFSAAVIANGAGFNFQPYQFQVVRLGEEKFHRASLRVASLRVAGLLAYSPTRILVQDALAVGVEMAFAPVTGEGCFAVVAVVLAEFADFAIHFPGFEPGAGLGAEEKF